MNLSMLELGSKLMEPVQDAASQAGAAAEQANPSGMDAFLAMAIQIGPILLLVVLFYLFLIRPQKKKEKEAQQMRSSIKVGDEITTIGGIIGRVVMLKDDAIVIETGNDRSKVRIARWAIQTVTSLSDEDLM